MAVITADEQGARRQEAAAEGHRRRGAGDGRLREDQNVSSQPHRRPSPGRRAATAGCTAGRQPADTCEPEWVDAEHPLFPLHLGLDRQAQGRAALHRRLPAAAALTDEVDLRPEARRRLLVHRRHRLGHGHTYITYGPLALGGTEIVFEGVPTYPDAGRFWKMIQDHKVTIFYTAPTAIRSLIKAAGRTTPSTRRATTCPACACWARWASRSTRRPGVVPTSTWAAAAARSSTPSGRPRPAAT